MRVIDIILPTNNYEEFKHWQNDTTSKSISFLGKKIYVDDPVILGPCGRNPICTRKAFSQFCSIECENIADREMESEEV